MSGRLRILYMGSAALSCAPLEALMEDSGCEVVGVVTQPDRPKGRDLKLQPTPVKVMAQRAGLPIYQPEKARAVDFVAQMKAQELDLIAVAAYGQILSQELLEAPRYGCLNVHTSLLPKYRGAAPVQRAILDDEPETGVTIMKMDEGLDTGGILAQERTPITPEDNAQTVHDRLAMIGAALLRRTLHEYVTGRVAVVPQPSEGASYAAKIKKQDGLVNWIEPARVIWNKVRGLVPWPCAFTHIAAEPRPQFLKLWQAQVGSQAGAPGEVLQADKEGILVGTGREALLIQALQREGGRRLNAQEFLAGHPLKPGMRLG